MILMEKETQKPLTPPRINDIDKVLRELGIGPGMPDQAHLTTHMVSLTEETYTTPSEAMAKVKNIATLMDVAMDEDFLERYLNTKICSFYMSPKAIPQELTDALKSLDVGDSVYFRIDREKKTLNPISKSQYGRLSPNERGRLHRSVLEGIREGGLLYTSCFSGTVWWVSDPSYNVGEVPLRTAFVESVD